MNKKFVLFIIGLILLLTFQIKIVMPFVYDIVSSDLFLEDTGDEKSSISKNTLMTKAAYDQCNFYIATELFPEHSFTFPKQALNAFKLGSFQYVINANIDIIPPNSAAFDKKYVCRIHYNKKHDTTGISDFSNWSVEGISGLDDI